MKEDQITINKINDREELETVFAIRQIVFVVEQNCPPELEWEFEDESAHFLAYYGDLPAGTGRWRKASGGYKLERFAVLKPFRGKGIAKELVKAVLRDLPADATYVYLNAQVHAIDFYSKFGFVVEGGQFEEAGISHYKMVKR